VVEKESMRIETMIHARRVVKEEQVTLVITENCPTEEEIL